MTGPAAPNPPFRRWLFPADDPEGTRPDRRERCHRREDRRLEDGLPAVEGIRRRHAQRLRSRHRRFERDERPRGRTRRARHRRRRCLRRREPPRPGEGEGAGGTAGEWAWTPHAIALYGGDLHTPHLAATLVQTVPKAYSHGHGEVHPTDGLDGYPAIDFFAPAGAPVVAPEDGLIERFSGHDPANGPVSGIHGPFGWTIYLRGKSGTDDFMTHLGSRTCAVDDRVHIGQQLGTVADYDKYGGTSHTHVGVHGGLVTIAELGNAALD